MGLTKIKHETRDVVVPFDCGTGRQIKAALGIDPRRVLIEQTPDGPKAINDDQKVQLSPTTDLTDAPWHEYGFDPEIANRLRQEALYVGQRYHQVAETGYDPDIDRWWLHVPQLRLPRGWMQRTTPILITVDHLYPHQGPDGFLLSQDLRDSYGQTPGHYFANNGRHAALTEAGWGWFCIHPKGWQGDYDFRDGDSIAKYLTLVELALGHVVRR